MVMYMMMHDTHVHEGDPVGCGSATKIERIELLFAQLRMIARRCARDVASFIHPQLADIRNDNAGTTAS